MPVKSDFHSEANYYATLLHELTHWSGSPSRLDRTKGKRFGDTAYAFEELIAELGSAFLCEKYAVEGDIRHEGYIQSWLRDKEITDTSARKIFSAVDKILQSGQKEITI